MKRFENKNVIVTGAAGGVGQQIALQYATEGAFGLSDQRLFTACADDYRSVQRPLADRTVLQMDQTAPAHQSFLRNQRECCQNADMDRHLRLPARGDHEKEAEDRAVALHNSTDFECVRFRENAAFTGLSERRPLERRRQYLQIVVAVGLMLGH